MARSQQHGLALTALLVAFLVPTSWAQQSGLRAGSVSIYPTLGLSVGYQDNIALSNEGEEIDSMYYLISPAIRFETGTERSTLFAEIGAEVADYEETEFDDYEDFFFSAGWSYQPTIRSLGGINYSYNEGHYRRGLGLREFIPGTLEREVDEYETDTLDAFYTYGAPGARGRLELNVGWTDFEYTNNRDITQIADYDSFRYGGALGLRVAPKTSLLLIANVEEFDYDSNSRDNDSTFLGIGAIWEATARTTGRAEFGRQEKDYDNGPDYSGTAWQASVEWKPREYSAFEFGLERTASDAFGSAFFVVREGYEAAWRHQWRSRFSTTIDAGYADEELRPNGRMDDIVRFGASANYQFRNWLLFGLGYQYLERDSSDNIFDYDSSGLLFSAEFSL